MLMLWLVLIERLEPWGRWPPPLQEGQGWHFVFGWRNEAASVGCNNVKKLVVSWYVIQHDIKERSGCCSCVRASGECAFVWKCVTHTKELRAAWPSWCCCHADMEPSESPGELKPCREEISALLRENSVKTNAATHSENSLASQLQYQYHREESRKPQRIVQTVTSEAFFLTVGREREARLTSRVVGGGHAWVYQALWG